MRLACRCAAQFVAGRFPVITRERFLQDRCLGRATDLR